MHGAKNDFVVLDARSERFADLGGFARWVCDRHAGIGADGVLVLEQSDSGNVRMRTINADGSEAEMCGNGIRCAARWIQEAGGGDVTRFATEAGLIDTAVVARDPEYLVRVRVGAPAVSALDVAWLTDAYFVDLGNPHVVIFRAGARDFNLEATALRLQREERFLEGTNVHVAAVEAPSHLRVRHWERGVGLTMACGTGAVACAAAAIVAKHAVSPVTVDVPGGRLVVAWDGRGDAQLTGPAVRVFDAEIDLDHDLA